MRRWFSQKTGEHEYSERANLSAIVPRESASAKKNKVKPSHDGRTPSGLLSKARVPSIIPGLAKDNHIAGGRWMQSDVPSSSRWDAQRSPILEQWITEQLSDSNTVRAHISVRSFLSTIGPESNTSTNRRDSDRLTSDETGASVNLSKSSAATMKNTLDVLCISRQHLASSGLDRDQIERVYKALYTYSVGVNELLIGLSGKGRAMGRDRHRLACHLWRVYIALVETMNVPGHQTAFSQLESQYRNDLFAIVSKSNTELRCAANALEQSRKESAELKESLQSERSVVLELVQRVDNLQSNLFNAMQRAEQDLKRHETISSQLEGVRSRLAASQCKVFLDRAQIRRLAQELRSSTKQVKSLTGQLVTSEAERDELTLRLRISENQERDLKKKFSEQCRNFNELILQYGTLTAEHRTLTEAKQQTECELIRELNTNRELRRGLHQLQTDYEEYSRRFHDANHRLTDVSTRLSDRIAQNDRDSHLITALKSDIGSLSLHNLLHVSRISDLESELDHWQLQLNDYKTSLNEARDQNVSVLGELREVQASNVSLEKSLSESHETISFIQKELETSLSEARRERSRVRDLKNSLAHSAEQLNEASANLQTMRRIKEAQISNLEQELTLAKTALDDQCAEVVSRETVIVTLKAELNTLKQVLESTQMELHANVMRMDESKRDKALLEQSIESQKQAIASLEYRLQLAGAEIKQYDMMEHKSLDIITELQLKIEKLKRSAALERRFQHDIARRSAIRLKRRHSAGKVRRSLMIRSPSLPTLPDPEQGQPLPIRDTTGQNNSLMNIMVQACKEMQARLEKQAVQIQNLHREIAKRGEKSQQKEVDAVLPKRMVNEDTDDYNLVDIDQEAVAPKKETPIGLSTGSVSFAEDQLEMDKLLADGAEYLASTDSLPRIPTLSLIEIPNPIEPKDDRVSLSRERTKMTARETLRDWANRSASSTFKEQPPRPILRRAPTTSETEMVMPMENTPRAHRGPSSTLEETLRMISNQKLELENSGQTGTRPQRRRQSELSTPSTTIPSASTWSIMRESEQRSERERRKEAFEKLSALRQKSSNS